MLSEHAKTAFLTASEVKCLTAFKASESWAGKFARDSGWRSQALHGEAGEVNIEGLEPEIQKLRDLIAEYDLDNVFNMDETGLFFKLLPNRSYVKVEKARAARGSKFMKAKDRVTLYVATNATGTDLVPLSIIGKSQNPRCLKSHQQKLVYFHQKKAWSDGKVFAKWWEMFLTHIRSKTSKKVLLIMDNCGPHGTALVDPQGQVKVVFLPPNCTSVYQPMDSGVIAMLKKNYRYKLLHKMFEIFDERQVLRENARAAKMALGTMGLKEGFSPHVRDVMDICYEVWSNIKPEQVRNCWRKSTLIDHNQSATTTTDNETVATDVTAAETVATDQSNNQHDNSVDDIFAEVVEFVEGHDCMPKGDEEFDEIVWEMALALKGCAINNPEAKKNLVDGWVSMEDNEQCNNLLAAEIDQMMDLEVLCNLKQVSLEDDEDDDGDDLEEDKPRQPVTFDEVNNLAIQLKTLQVQIDALGGEYHAATLAVSDAYDDLLSIYRKNKNKEISKKQKASIQASIKAFFKK